MEGGGTRLAPDAAFRRDFYNLVLYFATTSAVIFGWMEQKYL